ncbi:MAG: FAD-dependent oxidoreductase [Deltaproteobacteria bacterium]|nr:FAD-dependent oxidoreductase [Deltaproteobacteria bacterium]
MDINLLTSLNDNIRIDREKCTSCGRCVEVCILDNLRLQLSPCRQACPIGMNCQEYSRLLARGKGDKGLEKIRETVPFGGILGRICSKPCGAACNRAKVDSQPVAIRDLKRFLTDQYSLHWNPPANGDLPQKVAIVGAGPAGLTAAFFLRSQGFQVTLILEREIGFIKSMGIEFEGNRRLGKDLDLPVLGEKFDAVLVAIGAHKPVCLNVPGEKDSSIWPVLDFMKKVRVTKTLPIGERVVVIGGGNAAVDAAQTAWRLGAKKVHLVSLEKRQEMPAFPWSIAEAEPEGVNILNGWGPQEFRLVKGRMVAVSLKKCASVVDGQGNFCPSYDPKNTMELPADTVILAIGQKVEMGSLGPAFKRKDELLYDGITLQTPNPKFFAAGDCLRGPKTIVEAMAQGKEAALSIQRFLLGENLHYGRGNGSPYETQFEVDLSKAGCPCARFPFPSEENSKKWLWVIQKRKPWRRRSAV